MLNEHPRKTYADFCESAKNSGILDAKTTLLLQLGAAMAVGCVPCMEAYLRAAGKQGITAEEIGAVEAAVMTVSAGRVGAQLREAERRTRKPGGCC